MWRFFGGSLLEDGVQRVKPGGEDLRRLFITARALELSDDWLFVFLENPAQDAGVDSDSPGVIDARGIGEAGEPASDLVGNRAEPCGEVE